MKKNSRCCVRYVKKEDLNDLCKLYGQLYEKETNLCKLVKSFDSLKENNNYFLLGAYQGKKLLGSILGIKCEDSVGECRPFMIVKNVITSDEARGKGIGKKMMLFIETEAKKHKCSHITLVTSKEKAVKFYNQLGYGMMTGFKKYLS